MRTRPAGPTSSESWSVTWSDERSVGMSAPSGRCCDKRGRHGLSCRRSGGMILAGPGGPPNMDRLNRRGVSPATVFLLFALCVTGLAAQEFRGTVTGRVTDSTGAIIPGASVTVTNVATGVAATATTNETGTYTVPYLMPGNYSVTFELIGFRKVARSVEVRVGDRVEVNAVLDPGAVTETVQVAAEAPLLDARSGSAGQVIDEQRIALLPLADGNPFVLARFAAGIVYN